MDDYISVRINTFGAALLAGCLSGLASVPVFAAVYSVWPKVTPYCIWPPDDSLFVGLPLSGFIGGGIAGTYVLYQSFCTKESIRFARFTSMVVLTLLFWHFLLLIPAINGHAFRHFSEDFAESVPLYFVLGIPALLMLRWQYETTRRLRQLTAASPQN